MPTRTNPLRFNDRTFPLPFASRSLPLDFDKLARLFSQFVTLVEIDWPSGTQYYSFDGVRSPSLYYEDLLTSIGTISREAPPLGGAYVISDVQIELWNRAEKFSKLKATNAFYGKTVRIKFGDLQDGLANMATVFTGRINSWNIANGKLQVTARDISYDRFRPLINTTMKVLDSTTFPNVAQGQEQLLVPVVYGNCGIDPAFAPPSGSYNAGGPVPCYRIDPNVGGKWRYVVAQHVCKSVDYVFVYGLVVSAATYTVSTQTYGSVSMTVIDFNADPVVANQASTLEVTAAVQGITNDGTPSGTLLEDPATQLQHFLLNYANTSAGEIDSGLLAAAQAAGAALSYKGAFCIMDRRMAFADVMALFSQSFLLSFFVTRESKFGMYLKTTAAPGSTFVQFTDSLDILQGTMNITSNPDTNVASTLQYNYLYSFVKDNFGKQPTLSITGESTNLSQDIRMNLNLTYVRDATTATNIANAYAKLVKENVQYAELEIIPDWFRQADLDTVVGITFWQGTASGGWTQQTARVVALSIEPAPSALRLKIKAIINET